MQAILLRKILLFLIDTALFWLSLFLALWIRRSDIFSFDYFLSHIYAFLPIYLAFIVSAYVSNLYFVPSVLTLSRRLKLIFNSIVSSSLLGIIFFYFFPSNFTPKTVLLLQALLLLLLISLWRYFEKNFLKFDFAQKILIIDGGKEGNDIANVLKNSKKINLDANISSFESYKNIQDFIHRENIRFVIIDTKNRNNFKIIENLYSDFEGVIVFDLHTYYEDIFLKSPIHSIDIHLFFQTKHFADYFYDFVKRLLDIFVAIPVFIVWMILHPWVYFNIKNDDKGEVFSIQNRVGKNGKSIIVRKYRTMQYTDGGKWVLDSDNKNKVTKFGYFLRKTRIDELPQVLSVLRGDLTLIGPRPDVINLYDKLVSEIPFYKMRYSVKPGLSGWAQTMQNTPPQTVEETIERLRYDLYYIKHKSILLDFSIILRTIKTVLSREGM